MLDRAPTQLIPPLRARLVGHGRVAATALGLRHRAFFGSSGSDRDEFDLDFNHLVIERPGGGAEGCCRLRVFGSGAAATQGYAAQFYDLSSLAFFSAPVLELGRLCIAPGADAVAVLRMIWAELTRIVDRQGVELLFGCASFAGADPARHAPAFSLLAERYLAPAAWAPLKAGRGRFLLRDVAPPAGSNAARAAHAAMPPLLRSYLAMGGRVGRHGVIDRQMGTCHVFTGVEVAAIPKARKRLLRADALDSAGPLL